MHRTSILTALLLAGSAAVAADYRAGVARIVITPQETMWAGGYGARTQPVSETLHDLYAKALVLEDAKGYRLVIITTDLLGLPRAMADPIADELIRRHGLHREQIVISSTHTHCGPVLRENLVDIYPMGPEGAGQMQRYRAWLHERIVRVTAQAIQHLAPCTLAHGVGQAGFAVNRRENQEKNVVGYPGTKGPVDHDVPVLRVSGPDGTLRVVLFGYACHNTVMNFYKWCGDYAGFAQLDIEAAHPGATAMFFMGCGGDQNPLPRRKLELCEKYGRQLADAAEKVLGGGMHAIDGPLAAAFHRVDLPFERVPGRSELQQWLAGNDKHRKPMARRLLATLDAGQAIPAAYPYPIQALQFGKDLTLVALGGEVVVDYSLRLKRELGREHNWVAAYCNDVFAYIPSRRVLSEGGYEGETAMGSYGLPSKWSPSIEALLVEGVRQAVAEVRGGVPTSQPQ